MVIVCDDTAWLGPDSSGNIYSRASQLAVTLLNTLLAEVLLLLIQCRLCAHEFLRYAFTQMLNVALCGNALRLVLQHSILLYTAS